MKKMVIIMLCLFCITTINISAYGRTNESYDSLTIADNIKDLLDVSSDKIIIKYYNGLFIPGFAKEENINILISDKYVIEDVYMIKEYDKILSKVVRGGKSVELFESEEASLIYSFYEKYAIKYSRYLEIDGLINIYCLNGDSSYDGVFIYYVTANGDYVLFKENCYSENMYFFELDEFYKFAKVVYEDRVKNALLIGGNRPVEELYDMTGFKIYTKNQNLTTILLRISFFVFVIIGIFIIFKSPKKSKNLNFKSNKLYEK